MMRPNIGGADSPPIGGSAPADGCIGEIITILFLLAMGTLLGYGGGYMLLMVFKVVSTSVFASVCIALMVLFFVVMWSLKIGIFGCVDVIIAFITLTMTFVYFQKNSIITVPLLVISLFGIYTAVREVKKNTNITVPKWVQKGGLLGIVGAYFVMCGSLFLLSALCVGAVMLLGVITYSLETIPRK